MTRRFVVRLVLSFVLAASALGPIAAQQSDRFYIVGFILRPGSYTHKAGMTVGEAIELAGGFSPSRTVTELTITRIVDGDKETLSASFTDVVLPNDTISAR